MSAHFPHWVGRVVGDDLSLAAFVGDTEHTAVFQTTFAGQNTAIKLIAADESAERHLERFELASKFSHPNLLRVLRFGRTQIDDAPFVYVVTEFAEENLAQVLPDRALTKEEAQQVLQATLDALTYLHQQGLVHSDLKPANIMAANDQLKLSIDGVHRTGESLSRQPDPHDAPEASSAVTAASDIWSLGVTLVQILTQQLPGAPASPNAGPVVPESVPAPFREIAQHCLLRTPELRWSLADINSKLNPKAKHTPTPVPASAKPAPKPVRAEAPRAVTVSRGGSKRPLIFIGIVAIIVAAIVVIPRLSHDQSHEQATTPQPASTPSSQSVPAQAAPSQSTPEQSTASPEQSAPATPANNETESAAPPPFHSEESGNESPAPAVTNAAKSESAANVKHITDETDEEPTKEVSVSPTSGNGVVHQVMPEVIRRARNSIHGTVRVMVNVNVDSSGNVVDSQFVSAGPSKYFANAAMDAARQWKFSPASTEARAWNLEFDFRRSGTQVRSAQQK